MSKERAKRRAERLAVLEKEKAARARKVSRRQRRRTLVRKLTPRVSLGRPGRIYRRSRGERLGIVLVPAIAVAAVWLFVPDVPLRIVLTIVILMALPALVVLILNRERT